MKTNMSVVGAILIAALPSCVPAPMGPPPCMVGGPGPNHQGGPMMMGPGPQQYGPGYQGGGYRQIGDPTRNVYGGGPQSYSTWGPVPQVRYGGPNSWE